MIFISGGYGFIGSNFVRHMIDTEEIVLYDKLTYAGNLDNLEDIESKFRFRQGDICDKREVKGAMKDCDIVVHFAAESHVDRSITNPEIFVKTNVLGTQVLLDCARELGIKKFIHMSTDEVYGSVSKGCSKETDVFNPSSPYSASKAGADLLVQSYIKTFNFPAIIVRGSNNFGPYQYPEKLIPLFATNLLENKKVPLYGTGTDIRDWIYVEDTCRAIRFLLNRGKLGEVYNIGGGNEKTNTEITNLILDKMGKDKTYIEHVKDRPGHDFRYAMDSNKIKELGWKQKHMFETAVGETIDWYKNNEEWWRKLK